MNRRHFLTTSALAALATQTARANTAINVPKGKAEHCIFIWLGGGMAQMDTFDPKKLGSTEKPYKKGSAYKAIKTSVSGVEVCEHLLKTAPLMDRVTAVRSVHHNIINEHAIATNFVHTGRQISGATIYPSIGSIVANQLGAANPEVPPYMLIGLPNVSRGPGFLGSKYGNIYLSDTKAGPNGFTRPAYVDQKRMEQRKALLAPQQGLAQEGSILADYRTAQDEALRLAGPSFMKNFELDREPAALREAYGSEFGQRCLLARRLVEDGVRFIEVSHNLGFVNGTGWDTHQSGQQKQHLLIQDLDTAFSTLIKDLEAKKLLDKTLIVLATEFGRPAHFDAGGGRDHHCDAFSMVLAGGGLNHQGAYGETDEYAEQIVSGKVSTPDFHATIHAALGINPYADLTDASRPVPITDGGTPIAKLFA